MMCLAMLLLSPEALQAPGASFGTAYKGCYQNCSDDSGNTSWWPYEEEVEVFSHVCDGVAVHTSRELRQVSPESVCVMDHLWIGSDWPGFQDSRLRYYIDGETTASVDFPFGLGNGSPHLDASEPPWSAGALFGRTGQPSGIFNTFPIPFGRSVRVVVELRTTVPKENRTHERTPFWIIVRGWRSPNGVPLPGSLGPLPPTARMRVSETSDQLLNWQQTVSLGQSTAATSIVFLTSLDISAPTYIGFLEGCFRAQVVGWSGSRLVR